MGLQLKGLKNVYEQIAEQYENYIRLGVIRDGEKLPSCRELAVERGINPNTVERAYALLEKNGFAVTILKKGTFAIREPHLKADLLQEAEKQIGALKTAGLTQEEVLNLVNGVYKKREEDSN